MRSRERAWASGAFTGKTPQPAGHLFRRCPPRSILLPAHKNSAMLRKAPKSRKEITMFAVTEISRSTQRVVCMVMSAVIVSFALTTGAIASQSALHTNYSVTITQLQ
jgi:hypothetical protein